MIKPSQLAVQLAKKQIGNPAESADDRTGASHSGYGKVAPKIKAVTGGQRAIRRK